MKDNNKIKDERLKVAISIKKPRCYNCIFAGKQFKIGDLTHLHCGNEKQYPKEKFESGELTAWDSLQTFSDICEFHEFKSTSIK